MAPYRSRIPFRPGREPRGSSPRSRRALPAFALRAPFRVPLHQAAIDCSASERGNRQGIHPYALRFSARFPSRPSRGNVWPYKCREFKALNVLLIPSRSDFNRPSDLNYSWSFLLPEGDRIRKESIELCNEANRRHRKKLCLQSAGLSQYKTMMMMMTMSSSSSLSFAQHAP